MAAYLGPLDNVTFDEGETTFDQLAQQEDDGLDVEPRTILLNHGMDPALIDMIDSVPTSDGDFLVGVAWLLTLLDSRDIRLPLNDAGDPAPVAIGDPLDPSGVA